MDRRIDAAIGELASLRHGAFARADALSCDITTEMLRTRVERGQLRHPHPDVYVVAGSPPTWLQTLHVAAIAAGPDAAVSHRAAAALWRMDGCRPGVVELTVPVGRSVRLPGVTMHRKRDLTPVDVEVFRSLRVTTPARTLIDLAAVARSPAALEEAVDSAVRDGLTSLSRLWWRWGELRRPGRTGCRLIGDLLHRDLTMAVPQSVLERRFRRIVEPLGLGDLRAQHVVTRPDGSFVARVDFALFPPGLVFELDGHGSHATRAQRRADAVRRNELELLGLRVVVLTYEQVCFEPAYVRDLTLRILGSLRHSGAAGPAIAQRADRMAG